MKVLRGCNVWVLPAQRASGLCVVFVVVQTQQQLGEVGVDLMVPNTGEDLEQQRRLPPEALKRPRVSYKTLHCYTTTVFASI